MLDRTGAVVRSYTSNDTLRNPDPARDPERYNEICKRTPTAADCSLPLYWPAPSASLATQPGMHRWSWDMHYDPIIGVGGGGGDGGGGAVPHRTYAGVASPWAPPGRYRVRLTVDGKRSTQPLTLRLDPRVKTPAPALAQLATLTREMYDGARATQEAFTAARALVAQLDTVPGADVAALKAKVDSLAPAPPQGGAGGRRGGRGGGRGGSVEAPTTLDGVSAAMMAAAMSMQNADVAPTAPQVAACARAGSQRVAVMAKWNLLRTTGLAELNAKRRAAGAAALGVRPAG